MGKRGSLLLVLGVFDPAPELPSSLCPEALPCDVLGAVHVAREEAVLVVTPSRGDAAGLLAVDISASLPAGYRRYCPKGE